MMGKCILLKPRLRVNVDKLSIILLWSIVKNNVLFSYCFIPEISTQPNFLALLFRKLKREAMRFKTYQNWSFTGIQPNILAKAGFYFFNQEKTVQCVFCLGIIWDWDPTHDPFVEHKRHFPTCPFVLGLPVGNVPIDTVTGSDHINRGTEKGSSMGSWSIWMS